jgi:hypothetical protein
VLANSDDSAELDGPGEADDRSVDGATAPTPAMGSWLSWGPTAAISTTRPTIRPSKMTDPRRPRFRPGTGGTAQSGGAHELGGDHVPGGGHAGGGDGGSIESGGPPASLMCRGCYGFGQGASVPLVHIGAACHQ